MTLLNGLPSNPEQLAWAIKHQRDRIRLAAGLAQISRHPDAHLYKDAQALQHTWARSHGRERRLLANAVAQLRQAPMGGKPQAS